ncbi:MAG: hypothetical protein ACN23H_02435, partial [Candidatus Phytoplasma vitis]
MKKQKILKYSKTSLCSFLFFIFIFSFSILFCNFIYGSEKELYEKQKENCINETKKREEKLFEMFYDFKEYISPMLKSLEDFEIRYKQLPADKRKENFDNFLNFYKNKEIEHLEGKIDETIQKIDETIQKIDETIRKDEKIDNLKQIFSDQLLIHEQELEKLKKRKKDFESLEEEKDFERKKFFLNPDLRELGIFLKSTNPKKYCSTYNDFFYYLYFDFILKEMNEKYDNEYDGVFLNEDKLCHSTQRDPKKLKRTQLFSYLPEVTNLQFKIEYLRYFYNILTYLKELEKPHINYFIYFQKDFLKLDKDFSNLIDEWGSEYEETNQLKRKEKLDKFFQDNSELFNDLDHNIKDYTKKIRKDLENDFRNNLKDSKQNFLNLMLHSKPSPKTDDSQQLFSSMKTSLYKDNLESPSLNKKELIEHIIHMNDELINKDLLDCLKEIKNHLYKIYVDYSIFVFRSSCLFEEDKKTQLDKIIHDKKKDLSSNCEKNYEKFINECKKKSDELNNHLKHLQKELEYQTQDIDHRYSNPVIDEKTQKQNIELFSDKSSLGKDSKTIYLQNPEDLKKQLQLQLDEIKNQYILEPFNAYNKEIDIIFQEVKDLINFINVSNENAKINEEIETKIPNETNVLTKETKNPPHYKTYAIKDNLKKLAKEYLAKIIDFIDEQKIVDARIKAYRKYNEFKEKQILNPYLDIISELQIEYYKLASDIFITNIKKQNLVDPNHYYNDDIVGNQKEYLIIKDLDKKNIDYVCKKFQDHLYYIYHNYYTKNQNFKLSLDNIQWIGQFLTDYKHKLIEDFKKCNIISEIDWEQVTQQIETIQSNIKNKFKEIQEPKNINNDHNIELQTVTKQFEEFELNLKNFELNQKYNQDYINFRKKQLDSLCKNIDELYSPAKNNYYFKKNIENLIDIVKKQHEKEIEIRKSKININEKELINNELD